jgi:hypothetical protein
MAVGFKPQVNLLSMGRKRPEWDAERQILRVTDLPSGMYSTGEVHGSAGFHVYSVKESKPEKLLQRKNQ